MLETVVVQLGLGGGKIIRLKTQVWDLNGLERYHLVPSMIGLMLLGLYISVCWAAHTRDHFTGITMGPETVKRSLGFGFWIYLIQAQLWMSYTMMVQAHAGLALIKKRCKGWLYGRTFGTTQSQGFWCILPHSNRHFCKDVNQSWIDYTCSVVSDNARYFCTPKRGRMVSYFWSPKYV
ncbi:hypothetical protein Hanom_Chr15g01337581 [Helianthus anomalus]